MIDRATAERRRRLAARRRLTGRSASPGDVLLGAVLAVIVVAAIITAVAVPVGWLIMLGFGIVHSFAPNVPAAGFWPCYGLGVVVVVLKMLLSPSGSK